jgi:hypothetical protein
MTSHTPTPPTTTGTTGRVLGLTIGGALLLAVVVVSIGTWQGARPRAAADANREAAVTTVSTAGERPQAGVATAPTTTAGGPAHGDGDRATRVPAVEPTVYLVESEERAQVVRREIDEQNGVRELQGQPPLEARVVWFDSPGEEVQFWAVWDGVRLEQGGREGFAVVDLRGR